MQAQGLTNQASLRCLLLCVLLLAAQGLTIQAEKVRSRGHFWSRSLASMQIDEASDADDVSPKEEGANLVEQRQNQPVAGEQENSKPQQAQPNPIHNTQPKAPPKKVPDAQPKAPPKKAPRPGTREYRNEQLLQKYQGQNQDDDAVSTVDPRANPNVNADPQQAQQAPGAAKQRPPRQPNRIAEDRPGDEPEGLDPWMYSTFKGIARWAKADKILEHDYAPLYTKYLERLRFRHLRLLEIGLGHGCDRPGESVGDSLKLWRRYLPHATISYIEINPDCGQSVVDKLRGGKIYVGDQANEAFLDTVIADAATFGGFDVIIDDGGHKMEEQITSFKKLWKAVKPTGIYVVEATITSYFVQYGGGVPGAEDTFLTFMVDVMHSLNCASRLVSRLLVAQCKRRWADMDSMDIFPEAVVFVKKPVVKEGNAVQQAGQQA